MTTRKPEKTTATDNRLILAGLILLVFLCAGVVFSGWSYNFFKDLGAEGGSVLGRFFPTAEAAESSGIAATAQPGFEPEVPPLVTPEPWNGSDRITMLLLGLDYRDWTAGSEASRSDTMILLTIDPITKTAGVLSIPRDLWAVIPGFKSNKINVAYYYGEIYKIPGGGPALAVQTVEATLGVPIDYYAQIDFSAFERFIDLIGGVKLDVPESVRVDILGDDRGYIWIRPGRQTLPGDLALAYARSRSTSGGDFDRAARQQLVIMAIRDRLIEPGNFQNLAGNATAIYNELSGGINTNLPLEDAIRLGWLAMQVQNQDIRRGIINEKYVTFGTSPDELAILIPISDRIRVLRDEIFATGSAFSPLTPGDTIERARQEQARLLIIDGSGAGLGNSTADYLRGLGLNVLDAQTSANTYSRTVIIDHRGRPFLVRFLVELMNIPSANIQLNFNPNSAADVEVILGSDWYNNNPMP